MPASFVTEHEKLRGNLISSGVSRVFVTSFEQRISSECAPTARKEFPFTNWEAETEMCWKGLGVHSRIWIPGLVLALPGNSVLCQGAACSLPSLMSATLRVDGTWAARLPVSPGWVPGKRAIVGHQEQVRR